MAPWLRFAALPTSLLILIARAASPVLSQGYDWPYSLPPDAKYYPEDEVLIKRDIDIQQKLQRKTATGVRKMSGDPGEKFYMDYWGFEQEEESNNYSSPTNATLFTSFEAPVRVHSRKRSPRAVEPYLRLPGWHLFEKRDFQCPSGTSPCTSVDRPNSCCATGSTCQLVEDTGLGDVGCCPHGQVCADSLSTCEAGYTSCPNDPGGGCCIPGYACYEVGCVQTSTATLLTPSTTTVTSYTTVTPSVSSSPSASTTPTRISTSTPTSTASASTLPPQISTVTRTITVTSSASNSLACSTGYRSCPASVGGGCCPTDRECGSANCPPTTTTSSATAAPPVRPTSLTTTEETTTVPPPNTRSTSTPTSTPTSTTPVSGCPTGFYACSAYYQGGCCQIGRNCDKTSCPASASTTLVDTGSLTIVAPTGSGITAPGSLLTGACANGWTTCAPVVGGGCCPSGYGCGATSCTASVSGGSGVGKMAPNLATRGFSRDSWTLRLVSFLASLLWGALAF
ncbi:hypothetical protein A1O3_09613 [Capronia epimyces CBS 606.96]|uniref:GPI anchored protein n=1 Tax=Capronia epimyces CBS 606.96 TaxID=1182542 RepID=W9XA97_9EURO|nr:uncharacterized protein A1O3_09613 [Capronia epimyces CBS 606.96]EXJ77387.1 hypothetical protein A1O3_09613 [Capronia epimyces CBS 606.96]